jgi:hypothetical protein
MGKVVALALSLVILVLALCSAPAYVLGFGNWDSCYAYPENPCYNWISTWCANTDPAQETVLRLRMEECNRRQQEKKTEDTEGAIRQ